MIMKVRGLDEFSFEIFKQCVMIAGSMELMKLKVFTSCEYE